MLALDSLVGSGDPANPVRVPLRSHTEHDEVGSAIINYGELDEANKLNGVGMRITFDVEKGAELWQGQFKDNKLHGIGRKLYQEWNRDLPVSLEYIGNWTDGKEHGYCRHIAEHHGPRN